ncbi:hypothetical protein Pcinc_031457 [Petrolisthes cinctipes]|uniref:SAM domain-containing protein n=1 Tax=Petrolisthes cinctipes TaxID=88211 RepID=A0AAE1EWK7_PETCI|nr:hypothetical protein Pcinc_031457 [Petrolisthes cinctipes]
MADQPLPEKTVNKLDGKGKEPQKFLYLQLQQDRTGDGTGRVATLMSGTSAPHFIPLTAKLNSISVLGSGSRAARTQGGAVVTMASSRSVAVGGVTSPRCGPGGLTMTSPRTTTTTTAITTVPPKPSPTAAIVRKPHGSVVVSSAGVVRPVHSPSATTITVLGSGSSGGGASVPGGGVGVSSGLTVTPSVTTTPILRPAASPQGSQPHPPVILHTSKVPAVSSATSGAKTLSPRLVPMPITQVRTGVASKAVLSYSSLLQGGAGSSGGSSGGSVSGNTGSKKDSHHSASHQPPLLLRAASPTAVKSAAALAKAGGATISIITGKGPKQVATGTGPNGGPVNMLSVNLAQANKSNMINFKISNGQIQTDNIPPVDVLRETRPLMPGLKQEERKDLGGPPVVVAGTALAHAVGSGSVTVSVTGSPTTALGASEPMMASVGSSTPVPHSETVTSSVVNLNPLSNLKDVTVIAKRRGKEDILQRAVNTLGGALEEEKHNGNEDIDFMEDLQSVGKFEPETEAEENMNRHIGAGDNNIVLGKKDGMRAGHCKSHVVANSHKKDSHREAQENMEVDGVEDDPSKCSSNFKDPSPITKSEDDVKPEMVKFSDLLKWEDGVGKLDGSGLKFKMNEFNAVEIVEDRDLEELKIQHSKRTEGSTRHHSRKPNYREFVKDEDIFSDNSQDSESQGNKSSRESDDICCCKNCGCYGLSSEFFRDSSFCSMACGDEHDAREIEWGKERLKQEKERQRRKRLKQSEKADEDQGAEGHQSDREEGASDDDSGTSNKDGGADSLQNKFQHPWQDGRNNFSWVKYLEHCGRAKGLAKAAPLKIWPEPFPFGRNLFKPGMKLEAIDPTHQSLICVMTVSEVLGYRMRLHFDGYSDQYDFWTYADSADIFPAGWCEKNGRQLEPPVGVIGFSWKAYLEHCKSQTAPRQAFIHKGSSTIIPPINFRVGMKLEAEDRKNMWVCVATVADVLDNRVLIHFDGWDKVYDIWNEVSSPYIHPVGWCAENGIVLHPPNNYPNPESFNWHEYLQETNSMAVPARAFKTRPPREFKKNMKVEVVDKRNPALIRVATISDVHDYQVKINFDGWSDDYDYWLDDDSQDIHPPSWCSKTGHPLQLPLTPEQQAEDVDSGMGCGTPGCKGVGHVKGPIYTTHHTAYGCPYSIQNINKDLESIIPDRLHFSTEKKKNKLPTKVKLDLRPNNGSKEGSEQEAEEKDCQKKRVRKRRKFFDELTPPEPIRLHKIPKLSSEEIRTGVSASPGSQVTSSSGVPTVIISSTSLTPSTPTQAVISQVGQQQQLPPQQAGLPLPPNALAQQPADPGVDMMVHQSVFNPGYNPNPASPMPHSWERHRHLTASLGDAKKSDVEGWNPDQVRELVARIPGCETVAPVFVEQQIDGEALLMMTQNDLVSLLHIKLGPALKIMAVILCLRNSA